MFFMMGITDGRKVFDFTKLGFIHCGTIYVEEDDYPRLAYEKLNKNV